MSLRSLFCLFLNGRFTQVLLYFLKSSSELIHVDWPDFKLIRKTRRPCLYSPFMEQIRVSKGAEIMNRYNQLPHLTQDTNWKVTNSELHTTNESLEVSPFPAGNHKAQINRRAQRHNKRKAKKHKWSTKEVPPWNRFESKTFDYIIYSLYAM